MPREPNPFAYLDRLCDAPVCDVCESAEVGHEGETCSVCAETVRLEMRADEGLERMRDAEAVP